MALNATIELGSKKYDLRELDYSIEKPVGANFEPKSAPEGGIINFTILSPMDGNLQIHEWMLSLTDSMSGKFILPLTHGIQHVTKEIEFEDAQCVGLQEFYSAGYKDASQMYMRIKVVANKIKFGGNVTYTHKTKKKEEKNSNK